MKIFKVSLSNSEGKIVYESLVPECHVQEKVDRLLKMNAISDIGAVNFDEVGDISDRYIQRFLHEGFPSKSHGA